MYYTIGYNECTASKPVWLIRRVIILRLEQADALGWAIVHLESSFWEEGRDIMARNHNQIW